MEVMEENFLGFGKSTFCGDATVPVDMLLSGARTVSVGFMQTQPQPIPLYKRGENTGRIVVPEMKGCCGRCSDHGLSVLKSLFFY